MMSDPLPTAARGQIQPRTPPAGRRSALSIRHRLVLLTSGLLLAATSLVAAVAYVQVRHAVVFAANEHLGFAADRLSGLLGESAAQLRAQVRTVASSTGARSLFRLSAGAPRDSAAVAAVWGSPSAGVAAIELWDVNGRRVGSAGTLPVALTATETLDLTRLARSDSATIGPIRAGPRGLAYPVIARVSEGGTLLGYAVQWRRLATSTQARDRLGSLIGADTRLYLGNGDGTVWTDFTAPVAAPPIDAREARGVVTYDRPGWGAHLAVARAIANTPWTLAVEIARAPVLARAGRAVYWIGLLAAVVLAVAIGGAWMLSGRLTRPLADLAAAAAAVAEGDYSRRVSVGRRDEIGALASTFNTMAASVSSARERLEAHTREIEQQAAELAEQATELEATNIELMDAAQDAEEARAAAEAAEAEQRALVDAMHDVVLVLDREGRYVKIPATAPDLLYARPQDLLGKRMHEVMPAHEADEFLAVIRRALETRDAVSLEYSASIGERPRRFSAVVSPMSSDRVVWVARDVTHEKEADAELRETRDILQAVVDDSPLAIIAVDPALTVLRWNPAAERLFGWTSSEMVGRAYQPVVPDDRTEESRGVQAMMLRGEPVTGIETQRRRKDGSLLDVNLSVASLHGADGRVTGGLAIMADITERKRLEAQFRQAQKMEAVGQLAGGVAHDFNNMLTAIASFSEFAAAELPPESRARADLDQVQEATQRAAVLTRQLLAFSRQQVLQPRVIDVNEVVGGLMPMLARLIGADIKLEAALGEALWLVTADPGQLEQVIVNLVVNARDAMPNGGSLVLETANVDLDESYVRRGPHGSTVGPHVMVAVTDTGVGMDAETQARIFEPFFTTKPVGRGTGLGLSMVYGVVKQTGASIWVYSEPGRGSTFKIYLPRTVSAPSVTDQARPVVARRMRRAVVLLVEDEPTVRMVARRTLEGQGLAVLEARNGAEALELSAGAREPIELVLTDLVMPEMGGRELARRLEERGHSARVLFMSGYTADAVNRQSILAPDDVFLEKPFTPDGLVRKVREVLSLGNGEH